MARGYISYNTTVENYRGKITDKLITIEYNLSRHSSFMFDDYSNAPRYPHYSFWFCTYLNSCENIIVFGHDDEIDFSV